MLLGPLLNVVGQSTGQDHWLLTTILSSPGSSAAALHQLSHKQMLPPTSSCCVACQSRRAPPPGQVPHKHLTHAEEQMWLKHQLPPKCHP